MKTLEINDIHTINTDYVLLKEENKIVNNNS